MNSFNESSEERQERVRARMTPLELAKEKILKRLYLVFGILIVISSSLGGWSGISRAWVEPLQRETELFPTCFKNHGQSQAGVGS